MFTQIVVWSFWAIFTSGWWLVVFSILEHRVATRGQMEGLRFQSKTWQFFFEEDLISSRGWIGIFKIQRENEITFFWFVKSNWPNIFCQQNICPPKKSKIPGGPVWGKRQGRSGEWRVRRRREASSTDWSPRARKRGDWSRNCRCIEFNVGE